MVTGGEQINRQEEKKEISFNMAVLPQGSSPDMRQLFDFMEL